MWEEEEEEKRGDCPRCDGSGGGHAKNGHRIMACATGAGAQASILTLHKQDG